MGLGIGEEGIGNWGGRELGVRNWEEGIRNWELERKELGIGEEGTRV